MMARGFRLGIALVAAAAALVADGGGVARAASACELGRPSEYVSESRNVPGAFLPASGQVDVAVLFVDYPDAPAGDESPTAIYNAMAPAQQYFQAESRGRLNLLIHPYPVWIRMPHPSTYYNWANLSGEDHVAYFNDAIRAADRQVNFAGQEMVDVVSADSATAITFSASVDAGAQGSYTTVDNTRVRYGSTFGHDYRNHDDPATLYENGAVTFEHETGHTLGLPDLYAESGDVYRFLGVWDPMSDSYRGTGFDAWQLRKLGWIDLSQTTCITKPGTYTSTLTPLDLAGGRKMQVIKTSANTAITVEDRRPMGTDAGLCGQGILISRVDVRKPTLKGPIVAARAAASTSDDYDCGVTANAAYQPGQTFRSGAVTVKVLAPVGTGYQVRTTIAAPASAHPPKKHRHKKKPR